MRRILGFIILGLLLALFCLAVGGIAAEAARNNSRVWFEAYADSADATDVRLTRLERQVRVLNEAAGTKYGPSDSEEARFAEYVRLKVRVTELEKCLCKEN